MKLALLLLATATLLHAQTIVPGDHAEFPLREPPAKAVKGAPAPEAEKVTFRVGNYDELGLNRTVENIQTPTLTVYRPAKPSHGNAAMVVCPGGGYAMEVIDREGHAIARYFAAQGLTVAVLKYRLPKADTFEKGLPDSQQDALEAIRYLRRRASEWQINPKRIGIIGFSAGGHLAGSTAMLGEAADGSRPDFAVLMYAVTLMHGEDMHVGSRERLLGPNPSEARIAEFSLEKRARPGLPPFFLCHATNDKAVPLPNAELLADALRTVNVPTELLIVPTGGHGFSLGRDEASSVWKERFLLWLDHLP
ncbi:MAG: alpha/beta hydrolase [Verrucomicrobiaceae bacterium]|nr:alpha/beta hydrolase [Verrucomicrobiaceae bacterium]